MTNQFKQKILELFSKNIGPVFLILIHFACLYFWWNFDHLWETLWIGLLFLLFTVIGLNILYFFLLMLLFDKVNAYRGLYFVLFFLFPISEYCTYYLAENPLDSYYIKNIESVSNIVLPKDIKIISKGGKRPDLDGHYHFTLTATFNSIDYRAFKDVLLRSNVFNDTTELELTNEEKDIWKINSDKLDKNLRILSAKGSMMVKLIDEEYKMVFLYNDI